MGAPHQAEIVKQYKIISKIMLVMLMRICLIKVEDQANREEKHCSHPGDLAGKAQCQAIASIDHFHQLHLKIIRLSLLSVMNQLMKIAWKPWHTLILKKIWSLLMRKQLSWGVRE